jgi:hypothetical protein
MSDLERRMIVLIAGFNGSSPDKALPQEAANARREPGRKG